MIYSIKREKDSLLVLILNLYLLSVSYGVKILIKDMQKASISGLVLDN